VQSVIPNTVIMPVFCLFPVRQCYHHSKKYCIFCHLYINNLFFHLLAMFYLGYVFLFFFFWFSFYLFLGDLGCLAGNRSKSPVYFGFCGLPFLTKYKYAFTLACAQAVGDLILGLWLVLNAPNPL